MRLLLAGFEPFGRFAENPSGIVAAAIAADAPHGFSVDVVVLPVVYATAWSLLDVAVRRVQPAIVLGLGLAAGSSMLRFERIAINLDDAATADEAGEIRRERAIVPGAPIAYATPLPVRAMASAASECFAAEVSLSAGAFLCNHVFFRLCHHAATEAPARRCGFVHLPCLPGQVAGAPSLSPEHAKTALIQALAVMQSTA